MAPCVHPGRLFLSALLLMLVTNLVAAQGVRPVPPSTLAAILAVLGLRGTPGLIVGNQLVLGSIDCRQLKQTVAEARVSGGSL